MRLRRATTADDAFCLTVHELAMREYVEPVYGWDQEAQRTYHAQWFNPERLWIIEDVDGRSVGVLDLVEEDDHLYLSRIELLPEAQGRGIGSAVLRDLLSRGREIRLEVFANNERAQRFYGRAGFTSEPGGREGRVAMSRRGAPPEDIGVLGRRRAADEPDMSQLASLAREVAAEWGVQLGEPFALSRYSYVAPAGEDAVLKVTPVQDDESDQEGDALRLWAGEGAVRLLRSDQARRAMLLERARPGSDTSRLPEDRATEIAVSVARSLWRPAAGPFRWIGEHVPVWLEHASADSEAEARLLAVARELYPTLDVGRAILVHGDFHHHNILDAGNRFVAIDPKPMLGEPEFDVLPFLWNPLTYRMSLATTERRIEAFAAAGLDDWRIRAWSAIRGAYLGADELEARILLRLVGEAST